MNIYIVGAGPAGSYAAYLFAKNGFKVTVFEEHNEIGKPIQCTGIVTSSIEKLVKIEKDCLINKIKKAKIFSPNGKCIEFNLKSPNLILDRKKFDRYLAEKAMDAGAEFFLNHKFITIKNGYVIIKNKNRIKKINLKNNILIGADGPLSAVARCSGLFKNRKFWYGAQARACLKNDNSVEFYPYIGKFAWVVPENENIVRIGVLAKDNVNFHFKNFLKKKKIKKIIENQGGIVPVYSRNIKTKKKNIYLVGDSAAQVKATTAGGIIQSMIAAKSLVDSIINKKKYEREWREKIGTELYIHLFMRRILDNFSKKDYDYLIYLFSKKKNKKILENYDRDFPSKFIIKMVISEPRLLYFLKNLV